MSIHFRRRKLTEGVEGLNPELFDQPCRHPTAGFFCAPSPWPHGFPVGALPSGEGAEQGHEHNEPDENARSYQDFSLTPAVHFTSTDLRERERSRILFLHDRCLATD